MSARPLREHLDRVIEEWYGREAIQGNLEPLTDAVLHVVSTWLAALSGVLRATRAHDELAHDPVLKGLVAAQVQALEWAADLIVKEEPGGD